MTSWRRDTSPEELAAALKQPDDPLRRLGEALASGGLSEVFRRPFAQVWSQRPEVGDDVEFQVAEFDGTPYPLEALVASATIVAVEPIMHTWPVVGATRWLVTFGPVTSHEPILDMRCPDCGGAGEIVQGLPDPDRWACITCGGGGPLAGSGRVPLSRLEPNQAIHYEAG